MVTYIILIEIPEQKDRNVNLESKSYEIFSFSYKKSVFLLMDTTGPYPYGGPTMRVNSNLF